MIVILRLFIAISFVYLSYDYLGGYIADNDCDASEVTS